MCGFFKVGAIYERLWGRLVGGRKAEDTIMWGCSFWQANLILGTQDIILCGDFSRRRNYTILSFQGPTQMELFEI